MFVSFFTNYSVLFLFYFRYCWRNQAVRIENKLSWYQRFIAIIRNLGQSFRKFYITQSYRGVHILINLWLPDMIR